MIISSLDNPKIKDYLKLKNKKYRDKKGLFIIEGMHLVLEAFKNNLIEELILEENEILPLNCPTIYVTNNIINKLSSLESPSNIMAVCQKRTEGIPGSKIILLDNIQDPGNLGTIIRNAVAFGFDTIVLGDNSVDHYNEKVVRATQGMLFHVNVIRKSLLEIIPQLQQKKYKVLGTKVTHGKDIREVNFADKIALVLGNEGNGVAEEILELCDDYIYINMMEACESLNLGVASGILMYEIFNRSNYEIY